MENKKVERIDITMQIGPFESGREWPMYSYERPAYILWDAIANGLLQRGWKMNEIKDWLQSKSTRWALDSDLGGLLERLGADYAAKVHEIDGKRKQVNAR